MRMITEIQETNSNDSSDDDSPMEKVEVITKDNPIDIEKLPESEV